MGENQKGLKKVPSNDQSEDLYTLRVHNVSKALVGQKNGGKRKMAPKIKRTGSSRRLNVLLVNITKCISKLIIAL